MPHPLTQQRILVAGASGVLGRAFLSRAIAAGHEVSGMSRSERGAERISALGATPIRADALDHTQVFRAVTASSPDTVVNLLTDLSAGDSRSNAALRAMGTLNLTDAARAAGVHRFVAASIAWVCPASRSLATEQSPLDLGATEPRRTTIVGVQALERGVRSLRTGVVLRFGQLYGEHTWFARDGLFAEAARAGLLEATETVTSFTHVADAAAALVLALDWPAGTWNVVDDDPAPGTEWVPRFAREIGAPPPAHSTSGDIGRPVSNRLAREQGLRLQHPSWRDGFLPR